MPSSQFAPRQNNGHYPLCPSKVSCGPGEYARARAEALAAAPRFPRGVGRPTKKQRRRLEVFFRQPNE